MSDAHDRPRDPWIGEYDEPAVTLPEAPRTIRGSVERHFSWDESEDFLHLDCRRCATAMLFSSLTAHVYILGEAIHHLQTTHGFPGAIGGWKGYLDSIPAPGNPS